MCCPAVELKSGLGWGSLVLDGTYEYNQFNRRYCSHHNVSVRNPFWNITLGLQQHLSQKTVCLTDRLWQSKQCLRTQSRAIGFTFFQLIDHIQIWMWSILSWVLNFYGKKQYIGHCPLPFPVQVQIWSIYIADP